MVLMLTLLFCLLYSWTHIGSSTWIKRRVVWTVDFVHIARKGDDNIIDSIPLAEAESIQIAENDGSENLHYIQKSDQNQSLMDLDTPSHLRRGSSEQDHTSAIKSGLKRLQSSKLFHGSFQAHTDLGGESNRDILQISTISDGFNSGSFIILLDQILMLLTSICVHKVEHTAFASIHEKNVVNSPLTSPTERSKLAKRQRQSRASSRIKRALAQSSSQLPFNVL